MSVSRTAVLDVPPTPSLTYAATTQTTATHSLHVAAQTEHTHILHATVQTEPLPCRATSAQTLPVSRRDSSAQTLALSTTPHISSASQTVASGTAQCSDCRQMETRVINAAEEVLRVQALLQRQKDHHRAEMAERVASEEATGSRVENMVARVSTAWAALEAKREELDRVGEDLERRAREINQLAEGLDEKMEALKRASLEALADEEDRRVAEWARDEAEAARADSEALRQAEEARRRNGESGRRLTVEGADAALGAFRQRMQESEGEAWRRLRVLTDSLSREKKAVEDWVGQLERRAAVATDKMVSERTELQRWHANALVGLQEAERRGDEATQKLAETQVTVQRLLGTLEATSGQRRGAS